MFGVCIETIYANQEHKHIIETYLTNVQRFCKRNKYKIKISITT